MSDDVRAAPLRAGETCWRIERAERAAFLVDGEAYFGALADTLERAQHSIWLLGWDFHSTVRLRRGEGAEDDVELVPLLERLVRERPTLRVRVLAWDFAMLYALEREFLPLLQFGAKTHHRIEFEMDSAQPTAASQHQKLVIVDDALAFIGGFDLTSHRWDTREHAPDDPRRTTPAGKRYGPFHDVQLALDGDAAAALGELARERWQRATGRELTGTEAAADPWPETLAPDVRDVRVGIARTFPAFRGWPEVREVEALYEANIAAARRWIYIENQYLTSRRIGELLAERLREPGGPEVVIVGPEKNSGWLEENTMGALRDRVVRELRAADAEDRLRVLYPFRAGLAQGEFVNVHSKVMVVDDELARVGSSNLSNRSLGTDSECDAALVADGREATRRAIAGFRNDLLAEHLGTPAAEVAREIERTGSLVRAVDALRDACPERTLRPLELDAGDAAALALERLGAIDPEHPIPLEELVQQFEESSERGAERHASGSRRWQTLAPAIGVVALALAWQFTPLGDHVTGERLGRAVGFVRDGWHGPVLATLLFTVGCLLLIPVTALTVAVGIALGPALGIPVAWIGSILAAWLGHVAGRSLWRETVRRHAGERLNELSRRLARRGILASALLRWVPVAPFMVVNLVAGASHVRARDFLIGTALGILPGTALFVFGAGAVRDAVEDPGGPTWLWAGLMVLAAGGALAALRRFGGRLLGPAREPDAD